MKEVKKPDEIKKLMASESPVAIFYYAAWCPHCKVMHEPWKQLEKEDGGKTKFVKMESEDIPSELGISGYPQFMYVKEGKVQAEVSGEMSKDDLKSKLLGGLAGGRRRRTRSRRGRRTVRKIPH
jgi:thioredoxin-like negative regulator of GroEL